MHVGEELHLVKCRYLIIMYYYVDGSTLTSWSFFIFISLGENSYKESCWVLCYRSLGSKRKDCMA